MNTTFAFGKSGIEVQVPDHCECDVLESRDVFSTLNTLRLQFPQQSLWRAA
jgi:hypothetical protein